MKHLSFAALISALAIPVAASASERLFLQVPAVFDPAAPVPTAVRNSTESDTAVAEPLDESESPATQ